MLAMDDALKSKIDAWYAGNVLAHGDWFAVVTAINQPGYYIPRLINDIDREIAKLTAKRAELVAELAGAGRDVMAPSRRCKRPRRR